MFKTFLFHVAILNMMCFSFYHSAIAVNLKACNHFRLYNGKAAEVRFASVCLSDWLSLLSICLFVCLSICPSVCLSVWSLLHVYTVYWFKALLASCFLIFLSQAELKTLQETASPSFSFANDLIKHNLVSNVIWKHKVKSLNTFLFECAYYTHSMSGNQNWAALLKLRQCQSYLQLASSNT